jgi:L-lactate dehydrogenase complex protein LldF
LTKHPLLFRGARQLAAMGQVMLPQQSGQITRLPPPLAGWTHKRDFPKLARRSFTQDWATRQTGGEQDR